MPMKTRLLPVALVLCGACLFALTRTPTPAEQQIVAAEIDFVALHAQANGALDKLRQLSDQRVAMAGNAAF